MLLCSCIFLLCPAMHMIFLTITLADVFSGPFEARRSRGTYREAPASLWQLQPGTQSWRIWMRQSVPGERHHEATWRKKNNSYTGIQVTMPCVRASCLPAPAHTPELFYCSRPLGRTVLYLSGAPTLGTSLQRFARLVSTAYSARIGGGDATDTYW